MNEICMNEPGKNTLKFFQQSKEYAFLPMYLAYKDIIFIKNF